MTFSPTQAVAVQRRRQYRGVSALQRRFVDDAGQPGGLAHQRIVAAVMADPSAAHHVWQSGWAGWKGASEVPEIAAKLGPPGPPPPPR